MADTGGAKNITVIRKKIIKKGHGHHGGAWKVAYADFVTAMMAFFMVMWLMGSDEETKQRIAAYFVSADSASQSATSKGDPQPTGAKGGPGASVLVGADGSTPTDLVPIPVDPIRNVKHAEQMAQRAQELLDDMIFGMDLNIDVLKFSVPANLLFAPDSSELLPSAGPLLERMAPLFRSFEGYVVVTGHVATDPKIGESKHNPFEFTVARAVSVMQFVVKKKWIEEGRVRPQGSGSREPFSAVAGGKTPRLNERIEFQFSRSKT